MSRLKGNNSCCFFIAGQVVKMQQRSRCGMRLWQNSNAEQLTDLVAGEYTAHAVGSSPMAARVHRGRV